ncbi:serine hydrolase [Dyadobacter frigoris]|nr:serine hydrolase [Dyadobacter frigoris]
MREEVLGDLHERYLKPVKLHGKAKATMRCLLEALVYIRPAFIKRQKSEYPSIGRQSAVQRPDPFNNPDMIGNYFKIAFSLLLVTSLAATAQKPSPEKQADAFIFRKMQEGHITGLSLAVVKNGKVIKATGYGLANVETRTAATGATVYQIGSVSKQIVSAAIMILQQDGKLNITDKVSRYIPEAPAAWKDITLQRLLNHTAGLPLDIPAFDPYKIQTDSALTGSLFPVPLLYAPGDSLSYSNAAYFVIADVIRRISGMPWNEFISKRIFQPLNMTSTRTTTTTELVKDRARGYNVKMGITINAEAWIPVRPSGAFLSTVGDMAKWDAVLYGNAILNEESKRQLWSPAKGNTGWEVAYGLGWGLSPFQGHKRVFHNGGMPGFSADIERFIDDKLTIIVLCNTGGVEADHLALAVAGFYNKSLQVKGP